jgi:tripartite-type tricarboxylate transporter receptor subunit TctC
MEGVVTLARRGFLQGAASLAFASVPRIVWAGRYPSRPVHILVGFPPAGGGDIAARLIGQRLSERLGQPFIVENRPGGATNLATEAVVRAPADGHALLLAFTSNAINAKLYDKLNFNFIEDIAPVAGIMRTPEIMQVPPSFPAATVSQFISYAKAHPGTINMASGGHGALGHVTGELFKTMAGVDLIHVPYRGDAAAIADLLGGRVQVHFGGLASAIGFIRAGKLRLLAVTTATRSEAFPDVPTVAEFLPGYESSAWFGIGAPRNTPGDIIETLNREINAALADPKIKAVLNEVGATSLPGSSADFGKLIRDDTEKWRKVIRTAGIRAE